MSNKYVDYETATKLIAAIRGDKPEDVGYITKKHIAEIELAMEKRCMVFASDLQMLTTSWANDCKIEAGK